MDLGQGVVEKMSGAAGGGLEMGDARTVIEMFLRTGCSMSNALCGGGVHSRSRSDSCVPHISERKFLGCHRKL
jgi:hypothetical protein